MALDYFAISSQGVFPTPTPTGDLRAALAVSQGLLNITLPTSAPVIGVGIVKLGRTCLNILKDGILNIGWLY